MDNENLIKEKEDKEKKVNRDSSGIFFKFGLSGAADSEGPPALVFDFKDGKKQVVYYGMEGMKKEKFENVVLNIENVFKDQMYSKVYLDAVVFAVRVMDENGIEFSKRNDLEKFMGGGCDFFKQERERKKYGIWANAGMGFERMYGRLRDRGMYAVIKEAEKSYELHFKLLKSMNFEFLSSDSNIKESFNLFANLGKCCPEYAENLKSIIAKVLDNVNRKNELMEDYFLDDFLKEVNNEIKVFEKICTDYKELHYQINLKPMGCIDYKTFHIFDEAYKNFLKKGKVWRIEKFENGELKPDSLYKYSDKKNNYYLEMVKHKEDDKIRHVWRFKQDFNWESAKVFLKQFEKEIGLNKEMKNNKKTAKLSGGR